MKLITPAVVASLFMISCSKKENPEQERTYMTGTWEKTEWRTFSDTTWHTSDEKLVLTFRRNGAVEALIGNDMKDSGTYQLQTVGFMGGQMSGGFQLSGLIFSGPYTGNPLQTASFAPRQWICARKVYYCPLYQS